MTQTNSPINRLPVEILELIFFQCLFTPQGNIWTGKRGGPILISQICQYWREIVLSAPSLWSFVSIGWGHWSGSCFPKAPLLRAWIERSQQHLLSITVSTSTRADFFHDDRALQDLLHILTLESRRWRTVELVLPNLDSPCFSKPLEVPMRYLSRLRLTVRNPTTTIPPFFCSLFEQNVALKELTWMLPSTFSFPKLLPLEWSALTDLHLECNLRLEDCTTILRQSPLLMSLCCEGIQSCLAESHSGHDPHRAPSLLFLRLEGTINPLPFLQYFILPNLEELTLASTTDLDLPEIPSNFDLFRRSISRLKKLSLENTNLMEEELIQCLALAPHLESFEVYDEAAAARSSNLTDKIIHALYADRDIVLCPKLTDLKFSGGVHSTDGNFVDMVRTRWESPYGVARLKSVHVDFPSARHSRDTAGIADLRKAGLLARAFARS